ncbi:hypothetical protein [Rubrobacter indicoceani]|uniref:hypothetical protein n=1 Tax=Rubrobacter indicoceani TaxID=2051957 RepID=UPI000E5A32AD|nr:hypothetical protein [Rubrobacter indicoceani]
MGIRDFIEYLERHRDLMSRRESLPDAERDRTLREAEMMVGMADSAIRELESVINNRRINLPEEHAVRFAQDVFLYLKAEEQKVKSTLREGR